MNSSQAKVIALKTILAENRFNSECPNRFKEILKNKMYQEDIFKIAKLSSVNNPELMVKSFVKGKNQDSYKKYFTKEEYNFLLKYSRESVSRSHEKAMGIING